MPVTSWGYRGTTVDFELTFNSVSDVDHSLQFLAPRHPAALSDPNNSSSYNPKWTHTFAQWVEVLLDGTALWHRGDGTTIAFPFGSAPPGQPRTWQAPDSYHTLTAFGPTVTSPSFLYEDDGTTESFRESRFEIYDGEQTRYSFT